MTKLDSAKSTLDSKPSDGFPGSIHNIRGYTSTGGIVALIVVTFVPGIIYILFQWFRQQIIEDAIFVSMLIGATIILIYGISYLARYIANKGLNFCVFLLSKQDSDKGYRAYVQLCNSVFHFKRMTVTGFIYGMVLGSAPFFLGVWKNDLVLKMSLSAFLFFANFVTGIAFYGLIAFFIFSIRMGKTVTINLWQINNPSTDFFLGATRRIGILASIYISICISSILFSVLPVTGLVIAYSGFAGLVIIASILIPPLPVAHNLGKAKLAALLEIDKQIHLSFYSNLDVERSERPDIDYEKVKTLLDLREKIEAVSTWPFRTQSVMAAFSVILFSSIPIILQVTLERLL